jgi:hypothetical protein
MEIKHTPGPWKVRFMREEDIDRGFFVEAANNNKPELGYGIEIMGDDYGDHNGYPASQRLSDAKIIAAAPDMLDALITAKDAIDDLMDIADGYDKDLEKVIAAIKKATGAI